ncbi:MAG: carboxypeptidase regulatory-like domain-containing protein, partial [Thermodesulfobacteriota bacterium]|nr:carboxypeptidase regulatory-like domain-containing protein [Thermodesulfobacteriota bacterium]
RTKDGGGNWTGVHNGLGNWCRALKIHPKNPLIVYAGAASYLLKSTDGGENWSELQTPIEEIISLDVDPDNSNIIYAGGLRTGVYKSIDGGVTWTEINSGVKSNHVYDSDVIYSNERFIIAGAMGGIYTKTSDEDWEHSGQSYFSSVKIDKQNPNLLYAGTDYYLWKSTDYGKNWTQTEIPSSYSTAYQVRSIDIDPVYPQNLYAGLSYYGGTWGEIYKSYDYGGSFSLLFQAPVPVNSIAISQDTDKTKIFAGTGNFYAPVISGNLYKSEDNGITWEKTKLRNLVINTIFVDSTNPKFILVGCGDSTTSNYKILYKSEDGGSTWEEGITNLETPISAVTDIKQDEGSPNIFYIATFKDGIYVSYDRMETAELIGLSDYNLYDLSTAYGNETPSGSSKSTLNKTLAQTVYSGTGSGMYQYTPAGIGQLTGKVIDSSTGSGIMGAQVSAGAGGTKTIDTDGYYLLGLPSGTYSITAQKNGYSKGTINSIIVSSGGVTLCPDISLEPGGSTCPAEALLSGEAKKLNNLRLFRDNLKNSSRGLEYISIYYRNGNKFLEIINNSPSLRDEARSLLNKFIEESPEFTSSGNFNLSPELKFKLNEFVNKIEKKADKDLKGDIKRLKRDFNL